MLSSKIDFMLNGFSKGGKMKKKIYFVLFFVIVFSLTLSASLLDVYKSGKIKLVPDPNFGKGTDWDLYFPRGVRDIAFAKDGSFFATGSGHCVYKFDKNGKFIKKFGQKGRGPGDLYYAIKLSILDNKYLLVAEYATSRRISVFDLDGNFIKIIRTKEPVYDVVGLGNNKIAILTIRHEKAGAIGYSTIYFEDIKTDKKKVVEKYIEKRKQLKGQGAINIGIFENHVFLNKFKDRIVYGFSGEEKIKICDKNWRLLKSIPTGLRRKKVTKEEKSAFYKYMLEMFKDKPAPLNIVKRMYKNNTLLPENRPNYRLLRIDGEGNILVFENVKYRYDEKKKELGVANKIGIKVWSKDGKYVKEYFFDPESREGKIFRKAMLWFYGRYIYYFDRGDNEDELKRARIE